VLIGNHTKDALFFFQIFDFQKCRDLEIRVRGNSWAVKMKEVVKRRQKRLKLMACHDKTA